MYVCVYLVIQPTATDTGGEALQRLDSDLGEFLWLFYATKPRETSHFAFGSQIN